MCQVALRRAVLEDRRAPEIKTVEINTQLDMDALQFALHFLYRDKGKVDLNAWEKESVQVRDLYELSGTRPRQWQEIIWEHARVLYPEVGADHEAEREIERERKLFREMEREVTDPSFVFAARRELDAKIDRIRRRSVIGTGSNIGTWGKLLDAELIDTLKQELPSMPTALTPDMLKAMEKYSKELLGSLDLAKIMATMPKDVLKVPPGGSATVTAGSGSSGFLKPIPDQFIGMKVVENPALQPGQWYLVPQREGDVIMTGPGGAKAMLAEQAKQPKTISQRWTDLFISSGGVVSFNDDDVTITNAGPTTTLPGEPEKPAEPQDPFANRFGQLDLDE